MTAMSCCTRYIPDTARQGTPFVPFVDGSRLHLNGALRVPMNGDLWRSVRCLLQRGERAIVVDLARVPTIDAAGIGELVRAYNMTIAAHGELRVAHATRWVHETLQLAGLSRLLNG